MLSTMIRSLDQRNEIEALGVEIVAGGLKIPFEYAASDNRACILPTVPA